MLSKFIVFLLIMETMTHSAKSVETLSDISNITTKNEFLNAFQFAHNKDDDTTWHKLTTTGTYVIRAQLVAGRRSRWTSRSNTQVTAFVFPTARWLSVTRMEQAIRDKRGEGLFLYFTTDDCARNQPLKDEFVHKTFNTLRVTDELINVVVLSESCQQVLQILQFVAHAASFRWTALVHATEWFVLSPDCGWPDDVSTDAFPDFVTLVSPSRHGTVSVSQKSRTESLHPVMDVSHEIFEAGPRSLNLKLEGHFLETPFESFQLNSSEQIGTATVKMPRSGVEVLFNEAKRLAGAGVIRESARLYLTKQKSSLDGMHLAVSLVKTGTYEGRLVYDEQEGNQTVTKGYFTHLLKIFAEKLGFTYHIVFVNDGGYYGGVTNNHVNGLTGQLYRRETAFSIDVLSVIENRLKVIDFVSIPTDIESTKIVYRLPLRGRLDTTYLDIIHPDLTSYLSGALLVLSVAGAIVHLSTRSCFLRKPKPFLLRHLRLLYHFPEHCCFETNAIYADQSGRILKASWGVFWLILSSSYSAYLTTSFAVRPKEIRIASVRDMSQYSSWEIGVNGRITSFMIVLNSSTNELQRRLYEKLVRQNATNPMTFSDNVTYHMERVMAGDYFFITPTSLTEIPFGTVKRVDPWVRGYRLEGMPDVTVDNIGVPKNVFYKDDLYHCMLKLEEHGIMSALRRMYSDPGHNASQGQDGEPEAISFGRIELLVYVLCAGVGLSVACLVAEVVILKLRDRNRLNDVIDCKV